MSDRRYTVAEIDALRGVVEMKFLFGTYNLLSGCHNSRAYRAEEKEKAVEERVRTHMLAGHTAQDLIDSEPRHDRQPERDNG